MIKYDGSTSFFVQQIISDYSDENESNQEPKQTITNYTNDELLQKLRESKYRLSNDSNCKNLMGISQQIREKKLVSTVYYPYCGADVTHAFLLFPHCTTMVGFGRDDFGGIEDLNYYNENDDFTHVPLSYANGFDSHKYHEVKGYKYSDNKYKVCPDVLLRITQILNGEVISLEKIRIGDGENDIIYQINFMLDNIKRTFIYAKYEINCEHDSPVASSPVRDYLVSQSPDALLLKAIPDTLLTYKDGLALAIASVSQEKQIVLSDARTYNWKKNFHQIDEPQPVFSKNAKLDSINLRASFGYGSTIFIGNGSQLKRNHYSEEKYETPIVDKKLESVAANASQNPKEKNDAPKAFEHIKTKNQNLNLSMRNLKVFKPINIIRKKLGKTKDEIEFPKTEHPSTEFSSNKHP